MIDEKGKRLYHLMRKALLFKSSFSFNLAMQEFNDHMNELNCTKEMRYNVNGEHIGVI